MIMPGKLSTHVLDLTAGKPAAGMKIRLIYFDREPLLLKEVRTNRDGRVDEALLGSGEIKTGKYQLLFLVRDYFSEHKVECTFLDIVSVDFHIVDAAASYHVPLLVTPWSYSTYRGS
jgi:5-hydroxyisourate hydrolase